MSNAAKSCDSLATSLSVLYFDDLTKLFWWCVFSLKFLDTSAKNFLCIILQEKKIENQIIIWNAIRKQINI